MKPIETTLPSVPSQTENNETTANHSQPAEVKAEAKSVAAPNDLWQAIRIIIGLQNQAPPLVPVDRDRDLPLSFNQERLWLLEQLSSGNTAYNIPFALRLQGQLDVTALEQSFQEILRRHQALRTQLATVDSRPVQIVTETEDDWSLTIKQLPSVLTPPERETAIEQAIREVARQPFDLTGKYLLRACVVQLEPTEHLLLITIHHIAFDGWSEGIFWRELAALYESFTQGESSPLPELSIQYADFAVWQRQWLQNDFLAALNSYWQNKLGTNLQELALPTDYPAPAVPTRKSSTYTLTLSTSLTEKLKQLSYQSRATLFATLLTTFKILLYVYTEQNDLFVCSPIANRNRPELKQLMGYFVNLLILRSDLSGNPSFKELLGRVSKTVSGAYAHQDFPLQQLVQDLGLGQTSLSQVMFVLQNNDRTTPTLSGLTVEELEVDNGTADFDLSLSLTECQEQLIGVWKYNTDLFSAESITKMAEHWQAVLEKIVADPTKSIDTLLVLGKRDRQQLRAKQANHLSGSHQSQSKSKATNLKPRNALELRLTKLWSEILDNQQIHLQDNFFEVGGSSLLAFRLIGEIENSFGKKLPLSALLEAPTIEKLAKLISEEGETNSSSWLNPPQPGSSRPILFCIPPAGNSLLGFANLVHHLGADQPFYVPQPLGLEGETEPHERVEDMAAHYIKEIQTIQPVGPYYLGGRCFGGIVAFEMARQLSEQGEKVALLALIDGGMPPNIYSKLRNADGSKKAKSLAEYWQSFVYFCRSGQLLTILGYRYRQQLRKLKARFLPSPTTPDPMMANVQRVFQSHLKARAIYAPSSSYPGKITIFASGTLRLDQQASWEELATEGIDCHFIGGSHGTIDQEPHVGVLAAKLRDCLDG
ncbi:MAG: condensation domain-containing protein [Pleurocapsa sp. MO_192.B19]|nr:condensation domain-containing protein [Pleurocapsa sp. MO_192.B19]